MHINTAFTRSLWEPASINNLVANGVAKLSAILPLTWLRSNTMFRRRSHGLISHVLRHQICRNTDDVKVPELRDHSATLGACGH
jgi:hypothetical protein